MKLVVGVIVAATMLMGCQSVAGLGSFESTPAIVDARAEAAIVDVMTAQSEAWNRGDIPAFMEFYWKDDQLRFASGGNVVRGWQGTLNRYLNTYSSAEKMGHLDFTDLEVQPLAPDAAVVYGRWKLTRSADTPSGLFTLIFRNFGDGWVIISDTTTAD